MLAFSWARPFSAPRALICLRDGVPRKLAGSVTAGASSCGKAPRCGTPTVWFRRASRSSSARGAPSFTSSSPHARQLIISYIDNQPGMSALMRGFGRDTPVNHLLAFTWTFTARHQWFPQQEWVPSAQNISDPVSRNDLTMAEQLGWHRVDLDLRPFWKILKLLATELDYACDGAVRECRCLQPALPVASSTSCSGGAQPEAVAERHCNLASPTGTTATSQRSNQHS